MSMSAFNILTAAQEKLFNGDSLTNAELIILQDYYNKVTDVLSMCRMPKYNLVRDDAFSRLTQVNQFIAARNSR